MASADASFEQWHFVGRVNPATKELTWPSTGVAFTFEGSEATIGIDNIVGASSITFFVDDNEPVVVSNVNGTISVPGLEDGTHTVEMRKRSETQYGTFRVTDVQIDGTFLPHTRPERQIEIIGDSISVGYGLDGTLPCADSAALQNNPKTYGALTANALDADYSVVAWSGKGLIRNYPSPTSDLEPVMPDIYTRYGGEDPDGSYDFPSSWNPDVVIINLGTNDFAYLNARDPVDPEKLVDALVGLVNNIHSHYTDAEFFFMSSPLLGDDYPTPEDAQHSTHVAVLKGAMAELADVKTHFVDWPQQGSDVGCDYHPSAATHAQGAVILEEAIREVTGW
ncbi:hypothetical protein CC79DRAFT_1310627 [Sarocladium strictum]